MDMSTDYSGPSINNGQPNLAHKHLVFLCSNPARHFLGYPVRDLNPETIFTTSMDHVPDPFEKAEFSTDLTVFNGTGPNRALNIATSGRHLEKSAKCRLHWKERRENNM